MFIAIESNTDTTTFEKTLEFLGVVQCHKTLQVDEFKPIYDEAVAIREAVYSQLEKNRDIVAGFDSATPFYLRGIKDKSGVAAVRIVINGGNGFTPAVANLWVNGAWARISLDWLRAELRTRGSGSLTSLQLPDLQPCASVNTLSALSFGYEQKQFDDFMGNVAGSHKTYTEAAVDLATSVLEDAGLKAENLRLVSVGDASTEVSADTPITVSVSFGNTDENAKVDPELDFTNPTMEEGKAELQDHLGETRAAEVSSDDADSACEDDTDYLLSNPANAQRLNASVENLRAGKVQQHPLAIPLVPSVGEVVATAENASAGEFQHIVDLMLSDPMQPILVCIENWEPVVLLHMEYAQRKGVHPRYIISTSPVTENAIVIVSIRVEINTLKAIGVTMTDLGKGRYELGY